MPPPSFILPPHRKPTRTSAFQPRSRLKATATHGRLTRPRYAADHGLVLDTDLNLTDLGVSAYRGKNAKTGSLSVFLKAVEDGTVPRGSFLLVENIDRLTRDDIPDATMLLMQIINAGIVVVTLTNREQYSRERLREEPYDYVESRHRIASNIIELGEAAIRSPNGEMRKVRIFTTES
jgi:hypothetical protein